MPGNGRGIPVEAGHGISRATAYHHLDEAADVLSMHVPETVRAALVLTQFEHKYLN